MNILVTGGAGYIGSHFVRALGARGHHPVVIDNLSTGHEWAVFSERFHRADLADRDALRSVFRLEKIDTVVHFASSIAVGESVSDPMGYFRNNYVCTLNLLDAMVEAGAGRIVFSSSAAVYGLPKDAPVDEDAPKAPINPYGLTKHFCEETLEAYARAYGIKHISLRYFNAAGADPDLATGEAHDPETHLIPRALGAAIGLLDRIDVYGDDYPTPDGTCIRNYIHVLDIVEAHVLALELLNSGAPPHVAYNLGGGRGYSVREVIDVVGRITGKAVPVRFAPRREGDPPVLTASSARALAELSWRPRLDDLGVIVEHAWRWLEHAVHAGLIKLS